jgi:myo-inositol-1(or 4)-monophosphatase
MFSAERGGGAFLNGSRIQVSQAGRVSECLFSTGFPSRKRHGYGDSALYSSVALATQGARRSGSSAMDLAAVACGRLDFLWDIGLAPWDVAAGLLLVSEAGGRVSDLHGNRFLLGDSRHLLASNGRVHEELAGLFRRLVRE